MAERPPLSVLVACGMSLLAAYLAHQLVLGAVLVLLALQALCSLAPVPTGLRRTLVVVTPVAAFAVSGFTGTAEVNLPALATIMAGLQTAVVAGMQTQRHQRTALATALTLMTLSGSQANDPFTGLPIAVGVLAVLVAFASFSGVRGRQLVAPIALTGVLGLVLFLVVPAPQAGQRGGVGGGVAGGGRSGSTYVGDRLDLSVRGDLPTTRLLRVGADAPSLWRSQLFGLYDGRTWYGTGGEGPGARGATTTSYTATSLSRSEAEYAPGDVVERRELSDRSYEVDVNPYVPVESAPRGTSGADLSDRTWTQLPPLLPQRVRDLAQQLGGGVGRLEAASAISTWLRANVRYQLDSPVPGRNDDAVDRVLFVDKVGFCEQFAASEVVLLRSLGIPARLVTGLAYGQDDGRNRVYIGKDLHAWVELWVPGTGWVTDDPTAGSTAVAGSSSLRATVAGAVNRAVAAVVRDVGGRTALALLLVAVAGAVVLLVRRPRRRKAEPVLGTSAVSAYRRWNARLGARGRGEAESLRELGRRMGHPVAGALEVVEQELYAPVAPDPRGAVDVLDRS